MACESYGLKARAIVNDLGAKNRQLWKEMDIRVDNTFFLNHFLSILNNDINEIL